MIHFTNYELEQYLVEDLPYLDLTTHLQGVENKQASLEVFTRENIVVSCIEEACSMVEILNCKVDFFMPSKSHAKNGDTLIKFSGDYNDVHKAWRSAQVILEYSCKISTYTYNMKQEILKVNEHCELLTTRKTFPFAKKFCIKAVITGGAMPHRLNISETIVFFPQHRVIYNSALEFYEIIKKFKIQAPEKKIVIESETLADSMQLIEYGVDVLQIDKVDIKTLKEIIAYRDRHNPNIKIIAAGGINIKNAKEYAATGIDGIVTSSVYMSGMANIGTKMELIG